MTNLATSWTNFSESLIVSTAATVRDQRARSSFSASALFCERLRGAALSQNRYYCFSEFTCRYSWNHSTEIVLSYLVCLGLQQLIDYENHWQRFSLKISRVCPQCTYNFSRLLKLQHWITHFYGQNASKNSGGKRMRCRGRNMWSKLPKTWYFFILSFKLMH